MYQFVRKKWYVLTLMVIIIGLSWYLFQARTSVEVESTTEEETFEIHMVTNEIKTTTDDGQEIESYRWDPGTIFVPEGENVKIRIFGIKGKEHPFMIEGTNIKGTVKKGEETVLHLRFDEEGIYRLICTAHQHIEHEGPMIGYIVVD